MMGMSIHKETVTDLLWDQLNTLMNIHSLGSFRLVGGTALSLLMGHRLSADIDLFSDAKYGTVDFKNIYKDLKAHLLYVSKESWANETMGNSCFVGYNKEETVKLDLFYTEAFVYPMLKYETIRMASMEEIIPMKLDIIGRGGRKKDFWDIHALLDRYTLAEMLEMYEKKYPFNFSRKELKEGLNNFEIADQDPNPICFLGKHWELIKLDFEELQE
jgi:predicted nucleotidyltransferase component of viral defense system